MGADLSDVSVIFTALHLDATMDEGWHEHEFTVTAYRLSEPWTDGRAAREALKAFLEALAPLDGEQRRLPPEMWTNEAIAQATLVLGNTVKAYVSHDGMGAERSR